jgi:phosphoglycolate phosphatase
MNGTASIPTPAQDDSAVSRLPAPRAILFDWDNTLIDSWPCIHRVVNECMAHMGHPLWTLEETKRRIGRSMRDTFPEMFGDRWEEARDVFLAAFRAVHLDMLTVLDGTEPMLRGLATRGIPMGLVSNKTGSLLRREVQALGWEPLFFAQVGAGDAARDKPAIEAVELALGSAPGAVRPGADVWLVGDSPTDMACAHACGLTPILLRPWAPTADEFGPDQPLVHLSRGDHLLDVVDDLRAMAS